MRNQTIEQLHQMRLHTMATAFKEESERPNNAELTFDDRFGMLVEREWLFRENRRVSTRLKAAKLKHQATIEDIDFRTPRGVENRMSCRQEQALSYHRTSSFPASGDPVHYPYWGAGDSFS